MGYHVILEDCDSRIHQREDGEHETFEKAKQEVVGYLQELIGRCQQSLEHFQSCETFEDHGGFPPFTIWSKNEESTTG